MTTTGELRAIIEELRLIDIGDATSYLGEERPEAEEALMVNLQQEGSPDPCTEYTMLSRKESSS